MTEVFALIQYNNDDDYDASVIALFRSKESAQQKLFKILKKEFDAIDNDDEELEDRRFENIDDATWHGFKQILRPEVKRGDCTGLSYLSYKIQKRTIMD